MNLHKLTKPEPCTIEFHAAGDLIPCGKPAQWSVDDVPVCEDDMRNMAGMNSDNAAFFAPALKKENSK